MGVGELTRVERPHRRARGDQHVGVGEQLVEARDIGVARSRIAGEVEGHAELPGVAHCEGQRHPLAHGRDRPPR